MGREKKKGKLDVLKGDFRRMFERNKINKRHALVYQISANSAKAFFAQGLFGPRQFRDFEGLLCKRLSGSPYDLY